MGNKLKIGILVDSPLIFSWEYTFIEELHKSEYADIVLVLKDKTDKTTGAIEQGSGNCIFRLHQRIDEMIFLRQNINSEKKDLFKVLSGVTVLTINSETKDGLKYFGPESVREIREYSLDIIVKLTYGPITGDLLRMPTYGVWAFSGKSFTSEKEDTTGYFEIPSENPLTTFSLSMLTDQPLSDIVIASVAEATCSYSISLNKDKLFRRASFILPRVVEGISVSGQGHLDKLIENNSQIQKEICSLKPPPSVLISVINILRSVIIFISKVLKKFFFTDPFSWILLFNKDLNNNFLHNVYKHFTVIRPPTDKFWADPFVVKKDNRYFVFVEEFIYGKNKGHISVLEIDGGGTIKSNIKIIDKPYHMSYPFVFEADGVYYMIPETGEKRSIDLYRCAEFPGKWTFDRSIMSNINAVDSTLFFHDNKWWLFTVIDKLENCKDPSPELYLFYADNFLSGNWTSHRMNPIISDVRTARPAGRVFEKDGIIYRPSQNCAGRYGNSFDINCIVTMTETEYNEESVVSVKPNWSDKLKGTHTFNFDSDFTIIDAYSLRRRFLNF